MTKVISLPQKVIHSSVPFLSVVSLTDESFNSNIDNSWRIEIRLWEVPDELCTALRLEHNQSHDVTELVGHV